VQAFARSLAGRVSSRDRNKIVDNPVYSLCDDMIDDEGYNRLREAIASGELLPSERLVEEDLSRRLGIGRAAVRMALVRLEHDGLVERERNRGARVRRVTEAEAVEILEVRAALESLAARHAATRATREDARELRRLLREMRAHRERGDLMSVSETNARLHRRILEISGHATATRLSGMLISQIVRFQYRTVLLAGRPERSHQEHTAIVDAIAAGDADAAERAMRRHLGNVARALRERVAASAEPAPARRRG
jgi:DNA-binding GntR family transcriptional regulator